MTQRNAAKLTEHLLVLSSRDLEAIAFDKDEPAIVRGTAYSVLKATKTGKYETFEKLLNRVVGKPIERVEISAAPAERAKSFEEFCERAGYPMPFLKQVEMMRFGMSYGGAKLLLGSRGYGKTDYVVILGTAYELAKDFWRSVDEKNVPKLSFLLVTKSDEKNAAIIDEVSKALAANGVPLEKDAASALRVKGLQGKDHSLSGTTIGSSSLRGRHPKKIIMDDPVTEEDVSEAVRRRAQRVYNEASKLTSDILVIGQPVHKFDLYETLRPLDKGIEKMEVAHGTIPELDHDLEAMEIAGVSPESISASYHLKVISEAGNPLENCKFIDKFPKGSCVAFVDPSFEGGDYTAMSVVRQYFDGVAVFGKVWRRDWFNCVDDIQAVVSSKGVEKLCFETNSLGEQPIVLLRDLLEGTGVVGRKSTGPKHSRILAAGAFAHLIHLAKDSDRRYIDQTTKYEYGAEHDDAPDSLASCLEWIGLIRGRM